MLRAPKTAVEHRLDEVRVPALVVMGTKDPDFKGLAGGPEGEARLIAERLSGTVLMVDGAGHYPHVEMPDQVGPAIVGFLTRSGS
jgi:pimeloyl-ACP methyl ester carboxylesterase